MIGGYQPSTSVRSKAPEVFGTALTTRLGEVVRLTSIATSLGTIAM
jgi:hypothetical protein